jgi:hypothetical protein
MKTLNSCSKFSLLTLLALLLGVSSGWAATVTTTGSGNWNSTTANAPWPGGTVPVAGTDVVIANGNTVTVSAAVAASPNSITINSGGELDIANALTVTATTTVNGTLKFTATTGVKIFTGLVTVNGVWNESVNAGMTFQGGITTTPTFTTGSGVHTFSVNSQTLTGTFSIQKVTVTGVTLNNAGTLTVSSALAGTGGLTQGANATLNISSSTLPTITTLTATASGNTVNYSGTSTQVPLATTYNNLTLSGSVNTFPNAGTTVNGILTMAGTETYGQNPPAIGSTATLQYSGTAAQTTGLEFPTGGWPGSGGVIIANTAGTVTFNASKAINGPLTINASAKVDLGASFSHSATGLSLGGTTQSTNTSYGGTGSAAATINTTYFAADTGILLNLATTASVISVNYGKTTDILGGTSMAGLVPATNWNTIVVANYQTPSQTFYDNNNNAISGFTVTNSNSGNNSWSTGDITKPNQTLFADWCLDLNSSTPATMTFQNIPYQVYDLYVYQSTYGYPNGKFIIGTVTNNINQPSGSSGSQSPFTAFIQGTNYVKFTGLTGSSQVMTVINTGGYDLGVGAFQIVSNGVLYAVTATNGVGGTISPAGTTNLVGGQNITYTITGSSGYAINQVLVDGVNNSGAVSSGSYTFSNVTAPHTIGASFSPTTTYAITATNGTGGTISPAGVNNVTSGNSLTFTIAASFGYAINQVLVDGSNVGAVTSYTFTGVTAPHTIGTSFSPLPVNGGAGVISAQFFDPIHALSPIASTDVAGVVPTANWNAIISTNAGGLTNTSLVFVDSNGLPAGPFSVTLSTGNDAGWGTGGTADQRLFADWALNGGGTITFTNIPYTNTYDLYVYLDQFSATTVNSYTIGADTETMTCAMGYPPSYGFPLPGYVLGNNYVKFTALSGSSQVITVSGSQSGIAGFQIVGAATVQIPLYTITASAGANGTISPAGATTVTNGYNSPTYSITPSGGYSIYNVLVDGVSVGATNNYTFTSVNHNHTLQAFFVAPAASPGSGIISVNYFIPGSSSKAMVATNSVGAAATTNWNNISFAGPGGFAVPIQVFNDNSGLPVGPFNVLLSNNGNQSWNATATDRDVDMLSSWGLDGGGTATFTNIPYTGSYNLYVYFTGFLSPVGSNVINYIIGSVTNTMTQTNSPSDVATYGYIQNDNFVVFSNLTGSVQSMNVVYVAGNYASGVSGFQIVAGGSVPTITGATTATAFSTTYGTASAAQSFAVSGSNLTNSLTATAPSGFEVSSDGSTYAGIATYPQTGGSAGGTLWIRLAATAASGAYDSQNIVLSSGGATNVNITTASSGNTVSQATSTATVAVNNSPATYNGLGQAATVTLSGTNTIGTLTILTGGQALQTNANTYAVTASFVPSDTNYTTLTGLSAGNFIINKAAPVISWSNPADIAYGTALGGTQLNATAGGVAGAFVYTPASGTVLGAGNAQVLGVQFTPTDTNNYSTPAPQTASINVNPASLTITANSTGKTYGQNLSFAGTEFAASGLTNGDSVASATLTSAGATNTATVGSYAIIVTNAVGSGLSNYTISYVAGNLTVNPLVAALSGTRAYDGTTNAAGTDLAVTNTVNGDTVTLSGTGGLAGADVGTNAITSFGSLGLDNGAGTNYTLAGAAGVLVITNTPLVITANNDSKTYDGNAYATNNGVTYAGFVNGETNTDLAGSLSFTGSAQGAVTVGIYTNTPGGYGSANYLISYVSGTLTINQATPVINTAPTASTITYGQMLGDSTLGGGSATPSGGVFTFTTPSTVPPVGTAGYGVTYTPTDTTDYTNATTTVSVTVNPAFTPSTNAYLASLAFSPSAGFAPAFTSNVLTGYNETNAYGDTPTVTVTNADATATNTLIVNGVSLGLLTNSVASAPLTLGVGATNVVQVQVVSQDLSVTNLYVVAVTLLPPPLSTNALLAGLALTPAGTLSPAFDPGTTSYNATNVFTNNPVTVAATSADANATLALNFNGGGYGAAVTNSLTTGATNLLLNPPMNTVAVRVVSQDLLQTNTYTVNVLLQPSQAVPSLTNSVSGNNLVLTWPADHLGYRLLVQTNNLAKGVSGNINDWGTVPGTAAITTTNITIIKAGVTNEYYRLVYP